MNTRVMLALNKVANNPISADKVLGDLVSKAVQQEDEEMLRYMFKKPYISKLLTETYNLSGRKPTIDEMKAISKKLIDFTEGTIRAPFALDAMKKGKTIGAGVGGVGGILAGLALAKDKSLLHKILYSGGLGLLGAGAGASLGDTIADYVV